MTISHEAEVYGCPPLAIETWAAQRERARKYYPEITGEQLEALRRAGARRRHAQRIIQARNDYRALCDAVTLDGATPLDQRAVAWYVGRAIERALGQVGAPGSVSGSAPPGWIRAHSGAAAWTAAMQAALRADMPPGVPTVAEMLRAGIGVYYVADDADSRRWAHLPGAAEDDQQIVVVYRDDENCTEVARIDPRQHPVLAEHMLGAAIEDLARQADDWLRSAATAAPDPRYPRPQLPPQSAIELHDALVDARRRVPGDIICRDCAGQE